MRLTVKTIILSISVLVLNLAVLSKCDHVQKKDDLSPADLGTAIGTIYQDLTEKTVDYLKPRPDAAAAKLKIGELKEDAVQKLVLLGKQREAMKAEDRAVVDKVADTRAGDIPGDLYVAWQHARDFYKEKDKDLYDLIWSLAYITTYASFDKLKTDYPAEAQRLGIR